MVLGSLDFARIGAKRLCSRGRVPSRSSALSDRGRACAIRPIGFVFQFHHLLPEFTAIENVAMKLRLRGAENAVAIASSRDLLERFGLGARLQHAPDALSGGELTACRGCARACGRSQVLLADEPTGNLDSKTADALFRGASHGGLASVASRFSGPRTTSGWPRGAIVCCACGTGKLVNAS
jgi:lipoprotein-releasing system ATP-binding protein